MTGGQAAREHLGPLPGKEVPDGGGSLGRPARVIDDTEGGEAVVPSPPCYHRNVVESHDGRDDRRDDRLTHWRCLDCGDRFPLIGDTDQWKPKYIQIEDQDDYGA